MRIPLIAGNWKMFKTPQETEAFCKRFRELYKDTEVQALICAPAIDIPAVVKGCEGSNIMVGAQNVYFEKEGAFTGEVSVDMLKAAGCSFCIVGHSERRLYFGETDETVNKKAKALLAGGIRPIICVGESEDIRLSGMAMSHVVKQVIADFEGIPAADAVKCVVAYEPIWAIGTGRVATPEIAEEMCETIRNTLIEIYGEDTADEIIIQYGGSVKPENVSEIMDQPEIDGALVGGASLDPDKFMNIIDF
jgi:triosephosphate isomerase